MAFESIKNSRPIYYFRYAHYLFRLVLTPLTFIGVVFHEFAHKKFCQRYRIPVNKVIYFQFDHPAGLVQHAKPKYYRDQFFIAVAPFIINSALAYATFYALVLYYRFFTLPTLIWPPSPTFIILTIATWFGISLALHAIPSRQDASEVWDHTKEAWTRNPLVLLGVPFVAIILVVNKLRILAFDFLYTAALAAGAYYAALSLPV